MAIQLERAGKRPDFGRTFSFREEPLAEGPLEAEDDGVTGSSMSQYLRELGKLHLIEHEHLMSLYLTIDKGRASTLLLAHFGFRDEKLNALVTPQGAQKLLEEQGVSETIETYPRVDKDNKEHPDEVGGFRIKQNDLPDQLPDFQKLEEYERVGKDAEREVVESNLRLVVTIAKNKAKALWHIPLADIIQTGNMGLIRAMQKFDYRKGFHFSTYAPWWIRQAIGREAIGDEYMIMIPVGMREDINKMRRTEEDLVCELGREPKSEEVAQRMEISVEKLEEIKRAGAINFYASLDEPVNGGADDAESTPLGDLLPSKAEDYSEGAIVGELRAKLQELMEDLSPDERFIIENRYGDIIMTGPEIGEVIGKSKTRVGQLEKSALIKIKRKAKRR